MRAGLGAADRVHGVAGTAAVQAASNGLRALTGGRTPHWLPTLPRPVHFVPAAARPTSSADRVVYFPSCATRNMGPQRGDGPAQPLPATAERLFRKAGFEVVYPARMDGLCCGQPFESKGQADAAQAKAAELEAALHDASEGGRWTVVFDTSPCALRMQRFVAGRVPVLDSVEFLHDQVLPRLHVEPQPGAVAIHPTCSTRRMGLTDKLHTLAARCSAQVVTVDEVQCCGFAGDRGFTNPELNAHALRHLKAALPPACSAGYSSSRTCEIGLSAHAGVPYRSIIQLLDERSRARG
jgi:D-lactate dehydrogenase